MSSVSHSKSAYFLNTDAWVKHLFDMFANIKISAYSQQFSMISNVLALHNAPKRALLCAHDSFHREDYCSFRGFAVRPFCVDLRPFHSENRNLLPMLYITFEYDLCYCIQVVKAPYFIFAFMLFARILMTNRVEVCNNCTQNNMI